MKIVILGAGNLASHLAPALKKAGHQIDCIYSRSRKSAAALAKRIKSTAVTSVSQIPHDADLYIIAVADHAISDVVSEFDFIPKCIAHTSGSVPLSVFPKKFRNAGVLYPLQSFSKARKVNLQGTPICIKYRSVAAGLTLKKAAMISSKVSKLTSAQRAKLHMAAVFVNNFPNALYSIAFDILKKEKINFNLLHPLILETALKVQNNRPDHMQTGPARRGDAVTLNLHRKLLKGMKTEKDIYNLMSKMIENKFGPVL